MLQTRTTQHDNRNKNVGHVNLHVVHMGHIVRARITTASWEHPFTTTYGSSSLKFKQNPLIHPEQDSLCGREVSIAYLLEYVATNVSM